MKNDEINALIRKAVAVYAALTPEQKEEVLRAQARSWARGEVAMGDDADEARYRAATDAERECLAAWMNARADWFMENMK